MKSEMLLAVDRLLHNPAWERYYHQKIYLGHCYLSKCYDFFFIQFVFNEKNPPQAPTASDEHKPIKRIDADPVRKYDIYMPTIEQHYQNRAASYQPPRNPPRSGNQAPRNTPNSRQVRVQSNTFIQNKHRLQYNFTFR